MAAVQTTAELIAATRSRLEALDDERGRVANALQVLEREEATAIATPTPARAPTRRSRPRPRRFARKGPADADALLDWAREHGDGEGVVTTTAASDALGMSREATRKRFDELVARGALEPIGEGRARRGWRVLEATPAAADSHAAEPSGT